MARTKVSRQDWGGFRRTPPQGAFDAWVNIADSDRSAEEICRVMFEEGGVAANPGAAFADAGKEFIRFPFASSIATLRDAVERIRNVSLAGANSRCQIAGEMEFAFHEDALGAI